MEKYISFIHLSDIHFTKYSGDQYDVDSDLRNEIEIDIEQNAKPTLENVKGILVCGDIAFSGLEKEYEVAKGFLNRICNTFGISEISVFCVPGNHDVDQSVPKSSSMLSLLQKDIESGHTSVEIDEKLSMHFRDNAAKEIIFDHIKTYNTKFAGQYGCNINADNPCWFQDISLDDNSILRIFGMNSTIISSADDHFDTTKERLMIIGEYQIPRRQNGVTYLTLCHHPPTCWKDPEDSYKRKINRRAAIQLYGHKHIQNITYEENTLVIGSGATHPSRRSEDWIPRYNWLSLNIDSSSMKNILKIKIYPRIFDKESFKFVSDRPTGDVDYIEYSLTLGPGKDNGGKEEVIESALITDQHSDSDTSVDIKTLIYRFMNLSFITRTSILTKLALLDEKDEGTNHVDILRKVVLKAKESGILEDFWTEVNKHSK